jgi:hypothetical protein
MFTWFFLVIAMQFQRDRERERERELWTVLKAVAVLKGFTPLPKPLPLSEYLKLVA